VDPDATILVSSSDSATHLSSGAKRRASRRELVWLAIRFRSFRLLWGLKAVKVTSGSTPSTALAAKGYPAHPNPDVIRETHYSYMGMVEASTGVRSGIPRRILLRGLVGGVESSGGALVTQPAIQISVEVFKVRGSHRAFYHGFYGPSTFLADQVSFTEPLALSLQEVPQLKCQTDINTARSFGFSFNDMFAFGSFLD